VTEHPKVASVRVFEDAAGEWRWAARAGNHETVADSAEGYVNHGDALAAATTLFPDAAVDDS
jgi:uncharacterized protein YegP (UPF0339 family)